MRAFQILTVVLFCASLIFYLCAAVPRAQAEDDTMPVLTDDTGGEIQISVNAGEKEYYTGLHAEDAKDGDLTDEICIAGMSALLDGDRRTVKYVVFDEDRHTASLTRTVHYTDYTPPHFALNTAPTYRTGAMPALLTQITAQDVLDGDVSDRIKFNTENTAFIENDMYAVPISVTNSYGGQNDMTLYVQLSDSNLEIHLKQGIVYVKSGGKFEPKEYFENLFDRAGTKVKVKKLTVTQEIDTAKPGCYPVQYVAETEYETVRACLTVIVEEGKS